MRDAKLILGTIIATVVAMFTVGGRIGDGLQKLGGHFINASQSVAIEQYDDTLPGKTARR